MGENMTATAQIATLRRTDRWLLLLPLLGGIVFGLGPFVLGGRFGALFGYPGNDSYLYRLAGAAAFGYPVGLALGLRQAQWAPLRLPVIATLTFNLGSLVACALEVLSGRATPIVAAIGLVSLAITAITVSQLRRHADAPRPAPDITPLLGYGLILGGVLAGIFGVLPLLIPAQFAQLVGYKGTDVFLIRQAGAASLGYAVMAFLALKSRAWQEIRIPTVMALVFNGLAFVASVVALLAGDPIFIVGLIGAASLFYTIVVLIALRRSGKV
jgi:hypothetical protein